VVASQVTPHSNSKSAYRKLDLSKDVTLRSLMGNISSDIRNRAASLEGLLFNGVNAPASEDMLSQKMLELQEATDEHGLGEARALSDSDSESWYQMTEMGDRRQEKVVAKYQPSIASVDDGEKGTRLVPHQEKEMTTPLGLNTMEDLQVFHKSQWEKIVDCIRLNYWLDAEERLMELQQAATWFIGQNQVWLSIGQNR
jgi:hypothetical protein